MLSDWKCIWCRLMAPAQEEMESSVVCHWLLYKWDLSSLETRALCKDLMAIRLSENNYKSHWDRSLVEGQIRQTGWPDRRVHPTERQIGPNGKSVEAKEEAAGDGKSRRRSRKKSHSFSDVCVRSELGADGDRYRNISWNVIWSRGDELPGES